MLVIKPLVELPGNFTEFIAEMAPKYKELYGDRATKEYERTVQPQLNGAMAHSSTIAFGVCLGCYTVGIAVARIRGDIGQIAFVHVLREYNNELAVSNLMQRIVNTLHERNVKGIIMDCIPLCDLEVSTVLISNGFRIVDRMLMSYRLKRSRVKIQSLATTLCAEGDWDECGSLLYSAFRKKNEPILYDELSSDDRARQTLRHYRDGGYGAVQSEWSRMVMNEGILQGLALGTAVSDDIGFIFQVAVAPCCERQGIGTRLVQDLISTFKESGMNEVLLGVTLQDSAYSFYTQLGFENKRPVQVFIWTE